jgi:hypothetical protein
MLKSNNGTRLIGFMAPPFFRFYPARQYGKDSIPPFTGTRTVPEGLKQQFQVSTYGKRNCKHAGPEKRTRSVLFVYGDAARRRKTSGVYNTAGCL